MPPDLPSQGMLGVLGTLAILDLSFIYSSGYSEYLVAILQLSTVSMASCVS